jgi:hypothetical protein
MSFYDEASWVLIPEGIKEDVVYAQKPTDGLGDLTFTRASDATRTNSAGVIERTPWNLFTFSEQFDNAAWSKTISGAGIAPIVTPNTSTSPIGTLTADRIQFNRVGTTISDRSILLQNFGSAIIGRPYTFSIYIKANAPSEVGKQLRLIIEQGGAFEQIITINAEWTRYTFFAPSAGATNPNCIIETRGTVTANITVDVLVWGAQLVEGTDAKPYFATTNRQDVPRLDYRNADGSLNSCPRLLLEPQRTNSIRNSTMVGAVAGSPGTLPTNWGTLISTGGLTRTITALGTENGLQYIDIRFAGTATTNVCAIGFDLSNSAAAAINQVWTNSFYVKNIQTTAQADTVSIGFYEYNAAAGYVTEGTSNIKSQITAQLNRFSFTRTLTGATTAFVQAAIRFGLTIGTAYDFTIRIAAPQMELGATASTFIPTTTAAVTRLIDTPVLNNAAFLPTAYPFTLFADMDIIDTTVGYVFSFSNNAAANNYFAIIYTTNIWSAQSRPNGTTVSADGTFTTARGRHKAAAVFTLNTIKIYVDGVSVATATNTNTFNSSINDLNVGLLRTITDNGVRTSIFQSAVFNRELTNTELAQITTL